MTEAQNWIEFESLIEKWFDGEALSHAKPMSDREISNLRRQFTTALDCGILPDQEWVHLIVVNLITTLDLRSEDPILMTAIRRELRQWNGLLAEITPIGFAQASETRQ
ncbi:MAG TPA: hypothetical protein PLU72_03310 [Candidatus Ozemobacteraceae bacterium]|nr:hypothetical protein [Candidatus Ozemobacteraceae bacterium]